MSRRTSPLLLPQPSRSPTLTTRLGRRSVSRPSVAPRDGTMLRSDQSLSAIPQDPNTLRFIYSKAVNRALDRLLGDSRRIADTDVLIHRLPEIYDSLVFMKQSYPVSRGMRRRRQCCSIACGVSLTESGATMGSVARPVQPGPPTAPLPPLIATKTSQTDHLLSFGDEVTSRMLPL